MTAAEVSLVVEQLRRRVPGGIGTYARGLVRGLCALAEDVPAVELVASRPPSGLDPLAELGLPVRTSPLPTRLLTRLWDRGSAHPGTAAVAHATGFAHPRPSGRLVVTVHDLAFREVPDAFPPRGRRWHEQRLAEALRRADRFVVPAARTADVLIEAGAEAAKVEVIAEGADHLPPPDDEGARALLDRLGVDGPLVLTVSTLEPRKNLHRLFSAFARSGLAGRGWSLVVVGAVGWGTGPGPAPDSVVFAGSPGDAVLAGLYARAGLFAYVPLVEGFGLPPVEAMAAGVPVVASTQVPSVGDSAALVNPLDVDGLARTLADVATDPDAAASLRDAGRDRAASLTWRTAAAAHVELWRTLL